MPFVTMGSTPKPAQSPAASPAKGKAAATKKSSGRGVTKRKGRKPAPKKGGRGKGRGQKKTYEDPRVQAAYERQRELKDLYSTVSAAVKPALEEIADQSVKNLLQDPDSHRDCPEHDEVKQQLDDQYKHVIDTTETEYKTRLMISQRKLDLETERIRKSFQDSFDYVTENFLDACLNRANIIEQLRHEGLPLDTPDHGYDYVDHIPYVSFELPGNSEENAGKTKPATKRKAEGQPDRQGNSKKPRHAAGLLASEMQPDGVPESNAPSPSPFDEQEPVYTSKNGLPDLPIGASEPDVFGVRVVEQRTKDQAARLIVPQTFQWDDDEIGFRDSTNDSTKKRKKVNRGMFLDKPNSRDFHLDHTTRYDYDCRDYKNDTLDHEIVEKHGLHPKYGFFLPSSTNEAEVSDDFVDSGRPIVYVPDRNTTAHASRSVRLMRMDHMLKEYAVKSNMASLVDALCEKEGIDPDDITTGEMQDRERQARERLYHSSENEDSETSNHSPQTEPDDSVARERANLLLEAADHLGADKTTQPLPSSRPSRPYDAVRDVFTSAEPTPAPVGQASEDTYNSLNPSGITVLADLAEDAHRQRTQTERPMGTTDFAMIDPRILNQAPPPPNTFLQTALNPASAFVHNAPAHPSSMDVAQQPAPAPAAPTRNPFTNQGIRDSPVLPPLRPHKSDGLGRGSIGTPQQPSLHPHSQRPQEFGSPRGPIHTNSGAFYPPAPPRPYHQGFAFHEPPSRQAPNQGQPISGPNMLANQPHMAPSHHNIYPTLSPPPMSGQTYMPFAAQMEIPVPSVSPPLPPTMVPSPPINAPRQRGSNASNSNNNKYRRIAAAPVPHNRSWSSNGGPELRLSHYDYRESIKDYRASEAPPQSGPTTVRGWNVNNVSKGRGKGVKKEESGEKESPK
ncbi:hypothetical protein F4821DRAFT_134837 [Hypoxylon rubiginosum]|uniref:Uncharacterized protein n=1 Tax=Hypoxylon rubiginosum TaxID=110542 RepID=A0ACC0DI42_9PEZI|nr:hypothetical protein F4821DRAFT_134837 [Hypoxylon rubiginosum]